MIKTMIFFLLLSFNTIADEMSIQVGNYDNKQEALKQVPSLQHILPIDLYLWQLEKRFILHAGRFETQQDALPYVFQIRSYNYREANIQKFIGQEDAKLLQHWQGTQTHQPYLKELTTSKQQKGKYREDIDTSSPASDSSDNIIRNGWAAIAHKEYQQACDLFDQAIDENQSPRDAHYGAAYCRQQLNNPKGALPHYLWLIQQQFRPLEILPLLIKTYQSLNDKTNEQHYQELLHRTKLQLGIIQREDNERRSLIVPMMAKQLTDELIAAMNLEMKPLSQCRTIDLYWDVAKYYRQEKHPSHASRLYNGILDGCPQRWAVRLGIFYDLGSNNHQRSRLKQELKRTDPPNDYMHRVKEILLSSLMTSALRLTDSDPQKKRLLEQVIALDNDNQGALSALAWLYYQQKDYSESLSAFKNLSKQHPQNTKHIEGQIYCLIAMNKLDQAKKLARLHQLNDQLILLLEINLAAEKEPEKRVGLAKEIVEISPQHSWALGIIAWHQYQQESYKASAGSFRHLQELEPGQNSHKEGLFYSLMALKMYPEASQQLTLLAMSNDNKLNWQQKITQQQALQAYNNADYATAQKHLETLSNNKKDTDITALLAWSQFHQGKKQQALDNLIKLNQENPNLKTSQQILFLQRDLQQHKQQKSFIGWLSQHPSTALKGLAADQIARQHPYQAAQLGHSNGFYKGFDAASVTAEIFIRHKDGVPGTSELDQQSLWLQGNLPWKKQWQFSGAIGFEQLDSGTINIDDIGSNYLSVPLDGKRDDASWQLLSPHLLVNSHQDAQWQLQLGTTGFGGAVDPTLAFKGQYRSETSKVQIRQQPKNDSLLAYAGLEDPYSKKSWGRAMATGIQGQKGIGLSNNYWLGGQLGYHYIWGENIIENHQLGGSVAVGRQFGDHQQAKHQLGVFLAFDRYQQNSNFFTYGHGGYYSPQQYWALGPLYRYQQIFPAKSWWQLDISLSGFYQETNSEKQFPLGLRNEKFSASEDTGIGARVAWQGKKLLYSQLSMGLKLQFDQSPGYKEYHLGLQLQYFFSPRNNLDIYSVRTQQWGTPVLYPPE